jgi:molecular chaperone HtpG
VRLTFRLTDSPTCLVADDGEMSGYLQRMLKQAGQAAPQMQPILEVNPEHPLVKQLHADDAHFSDWCHLLFDQAMLAEGGSLEDPASFVKRTNTLLLAR